MENHNSIKIIIYSVLVAAVIFGIILLKAVSFSSYKSVLFIYTIVITTFMFSRVIGSFFYSLPDHQKTNSYAPAVTFVIPCKNEEAVIYKTITTCFDVDYDKNKIEVIAINDGSTDNTLKEMLRAKSALKGHDVTIVNWEKNRGKRHGMAEGFRKAKGEFIIQLDSDSYLERSALKKIISPLKDKSVGASVGHTLPANKDKNILTKMQTAYYFMSFRALKATESIFDMVFCCSGCFSAYRKSYVLPILDDWLDEKFMGKHITFGDDRGLTNHMLRQRFKTIYVDDAEAYTVVPDDIKTFVKQQIRWKKGWFLNSMGILKFIVMKEPFVAITYFVPLIVLTLLTPFIAFKALIISPLILGIMPIAYVGGIMLVSLLLFIHFNIYVKEEDRKYGKYMFLWSVLNMTIFSYILIYALYDLKNMAWGTR